MKVALCFWGQPRFIENPVTYEGVKKNFLDKYDVDVYVHTWFSQDGTMVGSNWSGINHKINPNTLNIIYDRYRNNLKRLWWQTQPNFLEDERFKPLRQQMYNHMHVSACIVHDRNFNSLCSQMVSTTEIINVIKHFGVEQYDWIVVMRQDCHVIDIPDLETLDPTKFYCSNCGPESLKEEFLIFHPRYIDALNMINALQTYEVKPNYIPNAEHIRYVECTKYVLPENIIPLISDEKTVFTIIRS